MKKYILYILLIFFSLLSMIQAIDFDKAQYSPALYDQVPKAKAEIKEWLSCQSNPFNQQLNKYWFSLQNNLFGKKISDIDIALDAWLILFTHKKYKIALRDLLAAKKVTQINKYYNQIDQLTLIANRMGTYLYRKQQENKTKLCRVSFIQVRQHIAAQYDIGIHWLDLVYQYKAANKYYRGTSQGIKKFNGNYQSMLQQIEQLNQIEYDK